MRIPPGGCPRAYFIHQNHSKSSLERFNFCHTYKQKRPSGVPGTSLERHLRNIEMLHFPRKYSIFGPEVSRKPPKAPQKRSKTPHGPTVGSKVDSGDGARATPRAPSSPLTTPRWPPLAHNDTPGSSLVRQTCFQSLREASQGSPGHTNLPTNMPNC